MTIGCRSARPAMTSQGAVRMISNVAKVTALGLKPRDRAIDHTVGERQGGPSSHQANGHQTRGNRGERHPDARLTTIGTKAGLLRVGAAPVRCMYENEPPMNPTSGEGHMP